MIAPKPSRLSRYLTVILRWLVIVAAVFILIIVSGFYLADKLMPKTYAASTQIITDIRSITLVERISDQQTPLPDPSAAAIGTMQSSDFLLPVIKELELEKTWGKRISKSDDKVTDAELLVYLQKNLRFEKLGNSDIIRITATSTDPKEAADIANAIAERYKDQRETEQNQSNHREEEDLREQIDAQQKVVDEKKAALEIMRQGLGTKDIEVSSEETGGRELETRKKALLDAQKDYDANQAMLVKVTQLPDDQFTSAALKELNRGNVDFDSPREEASKMESQVADLLKAGTKETDPRVVALRQGIESKRKQIADGIAGLRRAMRVDNRHGQVPRQPAPEGNGSIKLRASQVAPVEGFPRRSTHSDGTGKPSRSPQCPPQAAPNRSFP